MAKDGIGVYTAIRGVLTISGDEYPVSTVVLTLNVSTVPDALVCIADSGTDNATVGGEVSIRDGFEVYTGLAKMADELTECSLDIELESSAVGSVKADGDQQSLHLKNWILSEVEVGPISTTAAIGVTCRIRHPAYKLACFSSYIGSFQSPIIRKLSDVRDASSILGAADTASKLLQAAVDKASPAMFKNAAKLSAGMSPTAAYNMVKQLQGKSEKLSKYLEWKSSWKNNSPGYRQLPLEGILGSARLLDALKYSLVQAFIPRFGGSQFQELTSLGFGELGLSMAPTFTEDKLALLPLSVWSNPALTIKEDKVSSISLPEYDPNPVVGVFLAVPTLAPRITPQRSEEGQQTTLSMAAYVPSGLASRPNGRLVPLQIPTWLTTVLNAGPSLVSMTVPSPTRSGESSGSSDLQTKTWQDAVAACANSSFLTMFHASAAIRLTCPISVVDDEGMTIIPGVVASLEAEGGMTHGFVTAVTHRYDCAGSYATTNITMTHLRAPGGYPGVVTEPTYNPLWLN